uniref:Pectinesterase inhibitor domain-containing protein n=1 Tax=Kalanchoe fedtschenkoi TaxID=63787 RepID=A0A7N1A2Z4_KALFE
MASEAMRVSFVSLSRAKHVAAYVSREAESGLDDSQVVSVRIDCVSSFGDVMEQMRGSLKQMKEIEAAGRTSGGEFVRFWASKVQTWMSTTLTNQDTCTDGFEEVAEGPLKAEVGRRVGFGKEADEQCSCARRNWGKGLEEPRR